MSFVPIASPPPPSPRAQELGAQLKETINRFRQDNPNVTGTEIRQALGLAMKGEGTANLATVKIAVVLAVLVVGLLTALLANRSSGNMNQYIAIAIIFFAFVLVVLRKSR